MRWQANTITLDLRKGGGGGGEREGRKGKEKGCEDREEAWYFDYGSVATPSATSCVVLC